MMTQEIDLANLQWDLLPPESAQLNFRFCLEALAHARLLLQQHPYSLSLHLFIAQRYLHLGYPDLAVGSAYKALLLSDALQDDSDEIHEQALNSANQSVRLHHRRHGVDVSISSLEDEAGAKHSDEDVDSQQHVSNTAPLKTIYQLLAYGLLSCKCYQSAFDFCTQACENYSDDPCLRKIRNAIIHAVAQHFELSSSDLSLSEYQSPTTWPNSGLVRRECYPWNDKEPDRLNELDTLNSALSEVAPRLEVRVMDLPALANSRDEIGPALSRQLGVFAREDILPGETILSETSMLTANNKLQDALCDACSADLPDLADPAASTTVSCPDCEVVFCTQTCFDRAMDEYHPALCDMDVEAIAKDVPAKDAADSLYSLLLLRALAMAQTQACHPLALDAVRFIWADFHDHPVQQRWERFQQERSHRPELPRTLPFSFEHNIRLPFHMLEKMDVDIFANPQFDVWVFNTLYAKFRGTASARLSGRGEGRAAARRGPEVSAVHPMWCLANHSCDPNVSWEWGGSIKFWARAERASWQDGTGFRAERSAPGIAKGEEVLNHYCDVDLPVEERREWARGALGGDCRCARCVWESRPVGNLEA